MNLSSAKVFENEIVKEEDFSYAHDQSMRNIGFALHAILAVEGHDLVIGGMVSPFASVGMNIKVDPIYAHCAATGGDVIETEVKGPIPVPASDASQDRYDIVQVKGVDEDFDLQNRKFRDPSTKSESIQPVNTKKRIALEVAVKQGQNGSSVAPETDPGCVKIAEILVPAGTVDLTTANIKNISARSTGQVNADWTKDAGGTFNPGNLSEILGRLLVDHTPEGAHRPGVVKVSNLLLGIGEGAVNAANIPSGSAVAVRGTQYTALSAVASILLGLANSVNLAYPYADNVLGRYKLLGDSPKAASTGNIVLSGLQTIDGIMVADGDMVLLKDQENPIENGIWQAKEGAPWARYPGYTISEPGALINGLVSIDGGTANSGKVFYLDCGTGNETAIGTSPLDFRESIYSPRAIPKTVVVRDIYGRARLEDPEDDSDIATKKWVRTSGRPAGIVLHCAMTPPILALNRIKVLDGSCVAVGTYGDLVINTWDPDRNGTAEAFFRCDDDADPYNTRSLTGQWYKLPNCKGIFLRGAGSQEKVVFWQGQDGTWHNCLAGGIPGAVGQTGADGKPIVATLYDGGSIGGFGHDTMRNIKGSTGINPNGTTPGGIRPEYTGGAFYADDAGQVSVIPGNLMSGYGRMRFDASREAPTGPANKPASTSYVIGVTY